MDTSKGMRFSALPFLVIESRIGLILKRGATEVLVRGDTALETVLLILTRCSEQGASIDEICSQFAAPFREQVSQLISELRDKRLLVPEDNVQFYNEGSETNEEVFYWQFGTDQSAVTGILSDLHLVVAGVNSLGSAIYRSLHAMGVKNMMVIDDPLLRNTRYFTKAGRIRSNIFDPGTSIVSWKHFLHSEINTRCLIATSEFGGQGCLLPWNEWAVQHGVIFVPVYLQDMVGYLGPLVIPGETACLHCLHMRQNAHLHDAAFEREKEGNLLRGESIAAIHPSMITVVAETVVFELCRFFGALPGRRPGRHIKIDMTRAVTAQKHVLKIPRCPVCSSLVTSGTIQLEKPSPIPD